MIRLFTLCVFFCAFSGCSNSTDQNTPPPPVAAPVEGTPASSANKQLLPYPSLPDEIAQDLYTRCDFIDYIFYDPRLPMSISLDEPNSIKSTFNHLMRDQPSTDGTCKATGRVMYQHQGEYIIEADFYVNDECTYFIFMVDQKPTYANKMSADGVTFFSNNIAQAKKSVLQKLQQGQ